MIDQAAQLRFGPVLQMGYGDSNAHLRTVRRGQEDARYSLSSMFSTAFQ